VGIGQFNPSALGFPALPVPGRQETSGQPSLRRQGLQVRSLPGAPTINVLIKHLRQKDRAEFLTDVPKKGLNARLFCAVNRPRSSGSRLARLTVEGFACRLRGRVIVATWFVPQETRSRVQSLLRATGHLTNAAYPGVRREVLLATAMR